MRSILASDEFIISEMRPRRVMIAFFQRWYGLVIAVAVTLILLVNVAPYAWGVALLSVGGYWAYFLVKHAFRTKDRLRESFMQKGVQLARALGLILGVTALQVYLYVRTDYLTAGGLNHTLWLLLLLATLIVSQRGSTAHMGIALGGAIVSLIATTMLAASILAPFRLTTPIILQLSERILWLTLLTFTLHLFVRFVGNLYADVRLLNEATEELLRNERGAIMATNSVDDEGGASVTALLKSVVNHIARNYDVPHVNVFEVQTNQKLRCVAAASPAGQVLVNGGFELDGEPSLVFKAAKDGKAVLCNETMDQHGEGANYRAHAVFQRTRAELTVPLRCEDKTLGVLDIQAHHPQAFLEQDKDVMGIIAAQLARTLDNVNAHAWRRRFGGTIQSIAARLLAQGELAGTLQEIADSAHGLLEADIVVLYERNPVTGKVTRPTCSGELRHPTLMREPRLEPDGLLMQLLMDSRPAFFQSDITQTEGDPIHRFRAAPPNAERQSFEVREEVMARAVLRLTAGRDCVGIMFVNFRKPQEFSEALKNGAQVFANLAALAIRQAQLDELELEYQRKELGGQVHDMFGPSTREAVQGIMAVLAQGNLNTADGQRLSGCRDALESMQRDIEYLHDMFEDRTQRPLSQEVAVIANRVWKIYDIKVDVDWPSALDIFPPRSAWQIRLIIDELVLNALRHGEADRISISSCATEEGISFTVADNGRGFDVQWIKPSGIVHVRERVRRLGGHCTITTAPKAGTNVTITLNQVNTGRTSA